MKFGFSFDRTQKLVFSGEVDPSTRQFNIPKHLLRRLIINALVFVPLLLISLYLEQPFGFWFTLFWGGGITLWQVVAYGYFGESFSGHEMDVTRFYSKGTLIFLAVFWSVLITGVVVALYMKVP